MEVESQAEDDDDDGTNDTDWEHTQGKSWGHHLVEVHHVPIFFFKDCDSIPYANEQKVLWVSHVPLMIKMF